MDFPMTDKAVAIWATRSPPLPADRFGKGYPEDWRPTDHTSWDVQEILTNSPTFYEGGYPLHNRGE